MLFNSQNLLSAFDKKDAYHSPKCFSTVVVWDFAIFEPKDYLLLPENEIFTAWLYSIWEDKYTRAFNFKITNGEMEIIEYDEGNMHVQ